MTAKPFIISALLSVLNSSLSAADDSATTTIIGAKKAILIETDGALSARVETPTDTLLFEPPRCPEANATVSFTVKYTGGVSLLGHSEESTSPIKWDLTTGGLGIGFCTGLNAPADAGLEMGKSFEISWLNILAAVAENRYGNFFSMGVGVNWRNYRTTLGNCFTANNGHIDIAPYPEGVQPRLSRIKIFSIQFPLLYCQKIPIPRLTHHNMTLTVGPIFNLNTHASVLTSWRESNEKKQVKSNDINARLFTIDLFAALRFWDGGSIYVRYSPYRALTGPGTMNFNQLSTGFLFLM